MENGKYIRTKEIREKTRNTCKISMNNPEIKEKHRKATKEAMNRLEVKEKLKSKRKNRIFKHRKKLSIETIEKIRKSVKLSHTKEYRENMRKIQKEVQNRPEVIEKRNRKIKEYSNKPEYIEKVRKRMLDGQASYMLSCNKSPSKPQVELFNLVKQIDIFPVLNFQVKEVNKCIDIALPTRMIAIEYDGSYWHQDEEKDKQRQKQIESLGWKFIRYRDRIPTIDELRIDIFGRS